MINKETQIKNSIITKLSGIVLIFIIFATINFISFIVSYLILHRITGFLNNNFILLTSALIVIFVGSILKDLDSRLVYISPILYGLGGLLFLTILLNATIEFEYEYKKYYFAYLQSNYILLYLSVYLLIIFIS